MKEIRYSLKEILAQNETNPQKDVYISYSNASPLLADFFTNIKCIKEWNSFKQGKEYRLTKHQGELIIQLLAIIKLRMSARKGKDVESDPSVYFETAEIVKELFADVIIDGEPCVMEKIEHFLADRLRNEISIVDRVKEKMLELATGAKADESVLLRTYDRFVWMRAWENEMYTLLDKWGEIYSLMEIICDSSIAEENEATFYSYGLDIEMQNRIGLELLNDEEYQELKMKRLHCDEEETKEIDEALEKIEDKIRQRCGEAVADRLPVPHGIGGEELLHKAICEYESAKIKERLDKLIASGKTYLKKDITLADLLSQEQLME